MQIYTYADNDKHYIRKGSWHSQSRSSVESEELQIVWKNSQLGKKRKERDQHSWDQEIKLVEK